LPGKLYGIAFKALSERDESALGWHRFMELPGIEQRNIQTGEVFQVARNDYKIDSSFDRRGLCSFKRATLRRNSSIVTILRKRDSFAGPIIQTFTCESGRGLSNSAGMLVGWSKTGD